jgi:hypothetical protein
MERMMPACGIYEDELYPYYGLEPANPHSTRIELSPDEWSDYERVMREFAAWQARLSEAYRELRRCKSGCIDECVQPDLVRCACGGWSASRKPAST